MALEVRTRKSWPKQWAQTMHQLGIAYLKRGEEYFAVSVKCFRSAVEVRTRDSCPAEWADTMHELGVAYLDHKTEKDVEESIKCFRNALEVSVQRSCPDRWAQTVYQIGVACMVVTPPSILLVPFCNVCHSPQDFPLSSQLNAA